MSRSFLSCSLLVLLSGIGCAAQEPAKNLQESISRLEAQVERLGEHLKTTQEKAHVASDGEAGLAKLRAEMLDQERAWKERQSQQERTIAELRHAIAEQREQMIAEHAKATKEFERELRQHNDAAAQERERKARDEAEHLRAELASLKEHAGQRDGDRSELLELLAAERLQIAKLRVAIANELAHRDRGAQDAAKVRDENTRLRERVAALERELARGKQDRAAPPAPQGALQPNGPPPGPIVIDNANGEIHFHFHGAAPDVVMPPHRTPPRASDTAGPAGPSAPARGRSRDAAPREDAPREAQERDDGGDAKRVNYAPPAPVSDFVASLRGAF